MTYVRSNIKCKGRITPLHSASNLAIDELTTYIINFDKVIDERGTDEGEAIRERGLVKESSVENRKAKSAPVKVDKFNTKIDELIWETTTKMREWKKERNSDTYSDEIMLKIEEIRTLRKEGKLTLSQLSLLNLLAFPFMDHRAAVNQLISFYSQHCHLNIPRTEFELRAIVTMFRDQQHMGTIDETAKEILDRAGFDWGDESPIQEVRIESSVLSLSTTNTNSTSDNSSGNQRSVEQCKNDGEIIMNNLAQDKDDMNSMGGKDEIDDKSDNNGSNDNNDNNESCDKDNDESHDRDDNDDKCDKKKDENISDLITEHEYGEKSVDNEKNDVSTEDITSSFLEIKEKQSTKCLVCHNMPTKNYCRFPDGKVEVKDETGAVSNICGKAFCDTCAVKYTGDKQRSLCPNHYICGLSRDDLIKKYEATFGKKVASRTRTKTMINQLENALFGV
jgi:hypothetical protein